MQIGVGVFRHVIIEDDVHALDVHSASKQVGGHKDALLEVFELLVTPQTLLLGHCAVDGNGREVLFNQQLVEGTAATHGADKDDDLGRIGK